MLSISHHVTRTITWAEVRIWNFTGTYPPWLYLLCWKQDRPTQPSLLSGKTTLHLYVFACFLSVYSFKIIGKLSFLHTCIDRINCFYYYYIIFTILKIHLIFVLISYSLGLLQYQYRGILIKSELIIF